MAQPSEATHNLLDLAIFAVSQANFDRTRYLNRRTKEAKTQYSGLIDAVGWAFALPESSLASLLMASLFACVPLLHAL
jgi:hypothetical protein